MLRHDYNRIDPKRRNVVDHRKKQFASPAYKEAEYPHRLNFYADAPTADITLEQFEQWAIDRLRILAELEACAFRNKSPQEVANHMKPLLDKYLPLESNSSHSPKLFAQRQKDHYSHFILRLAFARTEDLRRRFTRVETMLFRLRLNSDDQNERSAFISSLDLDWWEAVTDGEKREYASELAAMSRGWGKAVSTEDDTWFKVDWDRVPELVEQRKVFLKAGKAFVPGREQASMVVGEFVSRLERQLEVGGDSNRRGGGYSPFSCQKILTEHPPSAGEAHGCPYRHFNLENLTALVQSMGVNDRATLQGVKEDKENQKFHMACNRVFEHLHKQELKKAKDEGVFTSAQLETIVHPNEYFKRSYLLKNLEKGADVKMEG
ncbi:putative DNA primase large subunit [Colletotrichum liriopes]|uniref:DNA primase large subunit n=1 Tax=Colletotrichum liriopes TaxID=708192 RepID=A0AA37H0D8_9PEZI|nr:putative DNA primase large subunit [Colletotrichum liriopes]